MECKACDIQVPAAWWRLVTEDVATRASRHAADTLPSNWWNIVSRTIDPRVTFQLARGEFIVSMRADGLTWGEIAKHVSCSPAEAEATWHACVTLPA